MTETKKLSDLGKDDILLMSGGKKMRFVRSFFKNLPRIGKTFVKEFANIEDGSDVQLFTREFSLEKVDDCWRIISK